MKTSMNIVLDNEGYELLQKTLLYFANRTNGDCQTSGKHSQYQVLCQKNIDHHFKRAVVYLLFRDPDHQGLDINSDAEKKPDFLKPYLPKPESGNPAIDEKCGYCGKYSPATKKCTRCKNVQYCSKECQTKHWPVHNKSCKAAMTSNIQRPQPASRAGDDPFSASKAHKFASTQCTYCKKSSDSLKKCLRCEEVQYCGKECQTSHWPKHKAVCSSSKSSHPTTSTRMPEVEVKSCALCGKSSMKLMSCGKCGKVKYCGKECQRKHWKSHKNNCK